MQTRDQYLNGLVPLNTLPEGIDNECGICMEEFDEPVALCPQHIFCQSCVVKWLTRRKKNTCPACRRELFVLREDERWQDGVDRAQVIAQALECSRLLTDATNDFDEYGLRNYTLAAVQRATAVANRYLAEDSHEPPTTGTGVIDMYVLGPHLIAMGNLLQAYASVTGRGYTRYQRRDWKIVLDRVRDHLGSANGDVVVEGIQYMAGRIRGAVLNSLVQEGLDVDSSRFFAADTQLESPAGDLKFLLKYLVVQCKAEYERRDAHRRAQQQALGMETSTARYAVRWMRQRMFDMV